MFQRFVARLALGAVAVAWLAGCTASDTRFYLGAFQQNADLRELFRLFNKEKDQENRFVLIQQIASTLENSGQRDKEILFLTTHVEKNPADIYNGYYLVLVADTYRDLGAAPMAVHYYRRVLANNVDLLVQGRSIHLHSLQELVNLDPSAENKIEYYKELISRWPEQQSTGSNWYYMAKAYEQVGEWEQAIQAYVKFTYSADTDIPGDPRAFRTAEEKIGYYSPGADKAWMMPDLQTLAAAVKDAIVTKNVVKLMRYEAKVNFFQEPWDQTTLTDDPAGGYNIAQYLPISGVRIEGDLDVAANDREAYLKTTGWNFRPPTWYLYFRKIDFPANPDINGQWEWAGIYFGEKL